MNPADREAARDILGNTDRIRIIEQLEVLNFYKYLSRACFVLTDSSGIQEKAQSFGKTVLVMRDTTERPEV